MDDLKYVLLKRIFDVAFSLLAIAVTGPLMLAIAAAIRLTSPGPILFVQERVGLNGETFKMYKFRSMAVSSSDRVGHPLDDFQRSAADMARNILAPE